MIKRVIIGIITVIIIIVLGIVGYNFVKSKGIPFLSESSVTVKGHRFTVTVANTPKEKEVGLSQKTSLDDNQGMLFPFDKPGIYNFWMRDMKVSLDIIYINGSKIVTVFANVQPPKSPGEQLQIYTPKEPADKVLEIKAGGSEKYNIKEGDTVSFSNF